MRRPRPMRPGRGPCGFGRTALPPPRPCSQVLHHYYRPQPPGPLPGAPAWALHVVLPHGARTVAEYLAQCKAQVPLAPFGLGWRWFAEAAYSMCEAVHHLHTHQVIHGAIGPDTFCLEPELEALGVVSPVPLDGLCLSKGCPCGCLDDILLGVKWA